MEDVECGMWNVIRGMWMQCSMHNLYQKKSGEYLNEEKKREKRKRKEREPTIREIVAGDTRATRLYAQITWNSFQYSRFRIVIRVYGLATSS